MILQDWCAKKLSLDNFRHLSDFGLEFSPDVTLLVGMNGSGKSAVLDSMAIMLGTIVSELGGESTSFSQSDARRIIGDLGSEKRLATSEPQYPVVGKLDAVLSGELMSWERRLTKPGGRTTRGNIEVRDFMGKIRERATGHRNPDSPEEILPVFAYYGVERLIGTRRGHGEIPSSRLGAYASALDPRSDLTRLSSFLESIDGQILSAKAYGDDEPTAAIRQFKAIELACANILEPVGWRSLRWNRAIGALTLFHKQHGTLPLSSLASGTKIAAGLAIDLASRIARANPQLGDEELLHSTPGIVLIDEVDLHLHPTWQQLIVPALRRTFPRVQFVLSTHSPQVIATVPTDSVRILEASRVRIPSYAYGLRSEAVLKEVQGTSPAPQVEAREKLSEYLSLVYADKGNTPLAIKIRKELNDTLGGTALNSELVDADAYLTYSSLDD